MSRIQHPSAVRFQEVWPREDLRKLTYMVYQRYLTTPDFCKTIWEDREAHDLIGDVRRGFIEQDMRAIGNGVRPDSGTVHPNQKNTSYHTRVVIDGVLLTESKVDSPRSMARDAEFRRDYANEYQIPFVSEDFPEREVAPEDISVYGIVIHTPADDFRTLPGFIHIAFPDQDYSRYVSRIDLLKEFPDIAQMIKEERDRLQEIQRQQEAIAKPAATLKPNVREKQAQG